MSSKASFWWWFLVGFLLVSAFPVGVVLFVLTMMARSGPKQGQGR